MKIAVIGHTEWCQFVRVAALPKSGEIIPAQETWYEAAGGGGVAAVQLARHADRCLLFTTVGSDEAGEKIKQELSRLGVEVYASVGVDPTNRAIVFIDQDKERSAAVTSQYEPSGLDESLPWHELADTDAVYFVGGDNAALAAARQARVLVSTAREIGLLRQSEVQLDALVMSTKDASEQYDANSLHDIPRLVVRTNGQHGGTTDNGLSYEAEIVPDDELQDSYGCGDSFAAGLTYALAEGNTPQDALATAAAWGAAAARRRGAHQENTR